MKKVKETQRQKFEARDTAIIEAASRVFAERGVDGAKMVDIAKAAGLAEGTLYLYHRNKQELLNAVVGHFWSNLTAGAQQSIHHTDPVFQQLHSLARYHLDAMLSQFELVQMSYRVGNTGSVPDQDLAQIRTYVRIFDSLVNRGIDRGEVRSDIELWQWRDIFFGTLEFAARTLKLRGKHQDDGVVNNLMALLQASLQAEPNSADSTQTTLPSGSAQQHAEIMRTLQSIDDKLTSLAKRELN